MILPANFNFCLCRDGTTDTTRTVHFGTPTAHEKVNLLLTCQLNSHCVWIYKKKLLIARSISFASHKPLFVDLQDAYTRVLKGQISLALTVFPNTTQGKIFILN